MAHPGGQGRWFIGFNAWRRLDRTPVTDSTYKFCSVVDDDRLSAEKSRLATRAEGGNHWCFSCG